jgi:hypothetical protein
MPDIVHRIGIKAPGSKVSAAVSSADGVAGWWTKETTGTSKSGGSIDARFRSPAGTEIGRMVFDVTKMVPSLWLPAHLRSNATVYDLNPDKGFDVARKGTNGYLVHIGGVAERKYKEADIAERTRSSPC